MLREQPTSWARQAGRRCARPRPTRRASRTACPPARRTVPQRAAAPLLELRVLGAAPVQALPGPVGLGCGEVGVQAVLAGRRQRGVDHCGPKASEQHRGGAPAGGQVKLTRTSLSSCSAGRCSAPPDRGTHRWRWTRAPRSAPPPRPRDGPTSRPQCGAAPGPPALQQRAAGGAARASAPQRARCAAWPGAWGTAQQEPQHHAPCPPVASKPR